MTNVAINGIVGQMGLTLVQLIQEQEDLDLVAGFDYPEHSQIGNDVGVIAGVGEIGVPVSSSEVLFAPFSSSSLLTKADVLIDFSIPGLLREVAAAALRYELGLVVGTTGQSDEDLGYLAECGSQIPYLISPNMSVGVNIMFNLVEKATQALGLDTDVEIYEIHHKLKIDSPSGTARRLGEIVADVRDQNYDDVTLHGREGNTGRRIQGSIGMHSARGGDIVGEHTVTYAGQGERIEITHRAQSRANFAAGALRAASFIGNKRHDGDVGSYNMNQVLGLI